MPVISRPQDYLPDDVYLDLRPVLGHAVYLKCEGFTFTGSVKMKAAACMVEAAERDGTLTRDSIIVESSSGNLGVALSAIAANKGYEFLCVTDPHCSPLSRRAMQAYGARVHEVDDLDVLFVGAGTTGTLMGCGHYFRSYHRRVLVVAVDSVGSVNFGQPPGQRVISGLGSSRRSPILDESLVDDVVHVPEVDAVRACHRLARRGFLFGGSTGTVITGAQRWLAEHHPGSGVLAVAIAPDFGERYLQTVYDAGWVARNFGPAASEGQLDE